MDTGGELLVPPVMDGDFTAAGDGMFLLGFNYPLLIGTETNAQIENNFFADGISYQVGVIAVNQQGIPGIQATGLVRDNTPPNLDTSGMLTPTGMGNDIRNYLGDIMGAAPFNPVSDPGGLLGIAANNMTTSYTLLENLFSANNMADTTLFDSIPLREGSATAADNVITGVAGTVGFDFITQVAGLTPEGFPVPAPALDVIYSRADLDSVLMTGGGTTISGMLNIRLTEPLDTMATLMDPVLSSPALPGFDATGATLIAVNFDANDGTVMIGFAAESAPADTIMDKDLIALTFSDIFAPDTGDLVDFTATGILDLAGNDIAMATTPAAPTLLLANHIPAAIKSAVATPDTLATDVLTLTFTRPVTIAAGTTLDAVVMGGLGLAEAQPANIPVSGGLLASLAAATTMSTLSGDGLTLTITVAHPAVGSGGLDNLSNTIVINGMGLQTNDAANSTLGGTLAGQTTLAVNNFGRAVASIRVEDLIPPNLVNVVDIATGGTINSTPLMQADTLLQVGDVTMDTYMIGFIFDQPIIGDRNLDGMIDAADVPAFTVTYTGMANLIFLLDVATTLTDMTGKTIAFVANLNPFAADVNAIAAGDVLTINGVTDLNTNAAAVSSGTLNANAAMGSLTIAGQGNIP